MTMTAMTQATDPLGAFMAGAFTADAHRPIPLVATRFDVEIDGGLATVKTTRVFRNDEDESIEATITFPVPVHAVLFALEARIDGRIVTARAKQRSRAREVYEEAVERGKAAVLHEEVLHGVHMLSVAHIGPGAEIEITSTWASTLSYMGNQGNMRIPLTVGDIYGRSGLPDSDDLFIGGPVRSADLSVKCDDGIVTLRGGELSNGRARVALNTPIDLVVTQTVQKDLVGLAADGRMVRLQISPYRGGDSALSVAVLVDHSGSMGASYSSGKASISKHQAVVRGLTSVARRLGGSDNIDLWEFDTSLTHIGSYNHRAEEVTAPRHRGSRFVDLIGRLSGPNGGTEIGEALQGAMAGSDTRDVLLITDGKSHALDVQELAQMGRRITVLLVGEDSLEANVGHLAAVTGGDILVASDADISDALVNAINMLRAPFEKPEAVSGPLDRLRAIRGNALLEAQWQTADARIEATPQARAVAAVAANLALSALDESRAGTLAEAEGLVTHLTSLVLVDEAGEVQDGVPAHRKIALPSPPDSLASLASSFMDVSEDLYLWAERIAKPAEVESRRFSLFSKELDDVVSSAPSRIHPDLRGIGARIDWDASPSALLAGDLSLLDPRHASEIEWVAALPECIDLANQMNISAVVLVVALIAQSQALTSRTAARIAKVTFGDLWTDELLDLAMELNLN